MQTFAPEKKSAGDLIRSADWNAAMDAIAALRKKVDELESAVLERVVGFGPPETKALNTYHYGRAKEDRAPAYKAETDGLVIAHLTAGNNSGSAAIYGYTGAAPDGGNLVTSSYAQKSNRLFTELSAHGLGGSTPTTGIVFPVRQGEHWKVAIGDIKRGDADARCGASIFWLPLAKASGKGACA